MYSSDLIETLQNLQESHGDLPVVVNSEPLEVRTTAVKAESPAPIIVKLFTRGLNRDLHIVTLRSHHYSEDLPKAVWL